MPAVKDINYINMYIMTNSIILNLHHIILER